MTEIGSEHILPMMINALRNLCECEPTYFTRKEFESEFSVILTSEGQIVDEHDFDFWFKEMMSQELISIDLEESYVVGVTTYLVNITILNDIVNGEENELRRALTFTIRKEKR